jgi:hypothetical protein
MSHSLTLLKLLIVRGPLTANQMVQATGLSIKQVHDAMQSLRTRGAMESLDRPYQVTATGRKLAGSREARIQRRAAKDAIPKRPVGRPVEKKKKVEIPEMPVVRRFIAAPEHADSIVSTAVESRPALQSAWGAPACA